MLSMQPGPLHDSSVFPAVCMHLVMGSSFVMIQELFTCSHVLQHAPWCGWVSALCTGPHPMYLYISSCLWRLPHLAGLTVVSGYWCWWKCSFWQEFP